MADSYRKRRSSLTMGERLLFLAGILFCLILITTAMLGGLLYTENPRLGRGFRKAYGYTAGQKTPFGVK